MRAHKFEGYNVVAGPPPGLDEMVSTLYCFHNGATCVSAWKPSAEELAALNAGESVYVSVMSGSRHDITGALVPQIIPLYIGTEETVRPIVRDTGKDW